MIVFFQHEWATDMPPRSWEQSFRASARRRSDPERGCPIGIRLVDELEEDRPPVRRKSRLSLLVACLSDFKLFGSSCGEIKNPKVVVPQNREDYPLAVWRHREVPWTAARCYCARL